MNKLFIILAILFFGSCQGQTGKKNDAGDRLSRQKRSLSSHLGEKLVLEPVLDSSGKAITPDFSRSGISIVDLWFNTCPPCIAEMSRFEELLKGKEKKITVISISINNFSLWKKTLQEHSDRFSFLGANLPNWKHYVLASTQDEKLKNAISADRLEQLREKYDVQFFPAYFVVDSNGTILSRPLSATKYIRDYK